MKNYYYKILISIPLCGTLLNCSSYENLNNVREKLLVSSGDGYEPSNFMRDNQIVAQKEGFIDNILSGIERDEDLENRIEEYFSNIYGSSDNLAFQMANMNEAQREYFGGKLLLNFLIAEGKVPNSHRYVQEINYYKTIGQFDVALDYCDKFKAESDPSNPWPHIYKANIFKEQNRNPEAIECYTEAIDMLDYLGPDQYYREFAVAFSSRAELLEADWKFYSAHKDYKKAAELGLRKNNYSEFAARYYSIVAPHAIRDKEASICRRVTSSLIWITIVGLITWGIVAAST